VITYEQTDPLFVLDLSDPRHPKIDGSVKISGFSTLLVPVNDKTLLGIGYCTETTELGEALDGTKLVLFDISDPSRPKVIDSKEFPGMNSPAQYEHKALLVGPEANWYAIPYDIWNEAEVEDAASSDDEARDDAASDAAAEEEPYYNEYHEGGVLTFSAGNKLTDVESHALSQEGMQRVIYINGYIYALDDADHITGMRF
jgi:uncharacterized secreted protein with C-terminal beta-propeller domain